MSITRIPRENWYISLRKAFHNQSEKVLTSLEGNKPKSHVLALDGVRAIAALAVLSYHVTFLTELYGFWRPFHGSASALAAFAEFGESGVILFFLLSGFLLFLPFAKALLFDGSWPSNVRFYLRRIFRIIPGYFVALCLIILFFHLDFLHPSHRRDLLTFFTFTMDYHLSQQLNGPFWTLAIEFQFYMLLPLIAGLFCLIVRRGTLAWRMIKLSICLLLMLTWGLLSRYWGDTITATSAQGAFQHAFLVVKPYVYGDVGKYFESFAIGMFLAMLYVYTKNAAQGVLWLRRFQRGSVWAFLAGLAVLGCMSMFHFYAINLVVYGGFQYNSILNMLDPHQGLFKQLWLHWEPIGDSIGYGLCIFAILFGPRGLQRAFEWPLLRAIGLISFSLYMWHLPFLFLILHRVNGWGEAVALISVTAWLVFLIFPFSSTFYRWIEMPGIRLGEMLLRKIEKPKQQPLPAASEMLSADPITPLPVPTTPLPEPVEVEVP